MDVVAGLIESLGPSVELRETHMSWVLLAGERAYKVKKPVHFGFLDLREPTARRRACEEEVAVNRALAAGIVLGVRAVVPHDGGCSLAGAEAPDAVDWVVEMRRFDEGRTMASAIRRNALRDEDVSATARTIARFHADAVRPPVADWSGHVTRAWRENLDELALAGGIALAAGRVEAWDRFASGFLRRRAAELDARARMGRVVDGHGDLRAEHVVLDQEGVTIVDRLEFDPLLRRVDVADDLAFLVMDLHALGAGWAAEELVTAYRDAGGEPGDTPLVAGRRACPRQRRPPGGRRRPARVDRPGAVGPRRLGSACQRQVDARIGALARRRSARHLLRCVAHVGARGAGRRTRTRGGLHA